MTAEEKMSLADKLMIAMVLAGVVAIAFTLWVFWGIASYVLGS